MHQKSHNNCGILSEKNKENTMRKLPDKIVKGCLHKKRFKDILQAKRSRQVIQVNDQPLKLLWTGKIEKGRR